MWGFGNRNKQVQPEEAVPSASASALQTAPSAQNTATFYSQYGSFICEYVAGETQPWQISDMKRIFDGSSYSFQMNTRADAVTLMQKLEVRRYPRLPTKFEFSVHQGEKKVVAKAAVDFVLNDAGTATATLSLVDAAGLPATLPTGSTLSVPTWTPSSPAIVVTPAADGLSATITPATPPVLATDVTIAISSAVMTNADASTVTIAGVTSEGIDVVSGGPAGFSIAL